MNTRLKIALVRRTGVNQIAFMGSDGLMRFLTSKDEIADCHVATFASRANHIGLRFAASGIGRLSLAPVAKAEGRA